MFNKKFVFYFSLIVHVVKSKDLKTHKKISNNFSLLSAFICEIAKDELRYHPEMRTIAIFEFENNFPSNFDREILKCLPENVAKINFNLHKSVENENLMKHAKSSLIILVVNKTFEVSKKIHIYFFK